MGKSKILHLPSPLNIRSSFKEVSKQEISTIKEIKKLNEILNSNFLKTTRKTDFSARGKFAALTAANHKTTITFRASLITDVALGIGFVSLAVVGALALKKIMQRGEHPLEQGAKPENIMPMHSEIGGQDLTEATNDIFSGILNYLAQIWTFLEDLINPFLG
jgi:hypothetical protein